jgi:hypothetical protein
VTTKGWKIRGSITGRGKKCIAFQKRPASLLFQWVRRGVNLVTHLRIVPSLRMSGAVYPLHPSSLCFAGIHRATRFSTTYCAVTHVVANVTYVQLLLVCISFGIIHFMNFIQRLMLYLSVPNWWCFIRIFSLRTATDSVLETFCISYFLSYFQQQTVDWNP